MRTKYSDIDSMNSAQMLPILEGKMKHPQRKKVPGIILLAFWVQYCSYCAASIGGAPGFL